MHAIANNGSSSSQVPSWGGTMVPTLCAATFTVQVVAGSDHVRVVWLHPQDPQGGVAQRRAKDGRLVLNVTAGKDDAHLNIPYSPFAHSLNLMFPP